MAEWGGGTARKLARSDVSIREFDAQLAVDSVWLLDTITGKEKRRGEKNQEKKILFGSIKYILNDSAISMRLEKG